MSIFPNMAGSSAALLHSVDSLIRLRFGEVSNILFDHLCTSQEHDVLTDSGVAFGARAVAAGSTEWQGQHRGQIVTLCWDWALLTDGTVCELPTVPPRSNICILDRQGYDLPRRQADLCLVRVISTLPWKVHPAGMAGPLSRPH